ncbi:MAG: 5-(carboxyamino)imidazole ribonucleotide mutase [Halobacteriovorax sp.]|nr:5-(carboxyamino)imidazole ribonucleotide mutase [Halobacteriovorax sp.]|tara:strand:+ start:57938 stop:58417 length:480 start_codon:yes stop_codon:yes gene_type:complete
MKKIAVIMGSSSDLNIMNEAIDAIKSFDLEVHVEVVSAHRTPEKMVDFGKSAKKNGFSVIIAGAGGAAHLPGMVASLTTLPVIGVPINSSNSIEGIDSLLSIAQMPGGVPVATVAVNGGKNAGLLAVQILGTSDEEISKKLETYKLELKEKVKKMNDEL